MKNILLSVFILPVLMLHAQQPVDTVKTPSKLILVPHQSMMYFSDADQDFARASEKDERTVRSVMANNLEVAIYHKLLAHFDAISLLRSTSLNGQEDLKRIYAATGYALYRSKPTDPKPEQSIAVKDLIKSLNKRGKENPFGVTDSSVMLANIQSDELFQYLYKKHQNKYVLFITQFEIETSNKNMIEWTKQQYERVYKIHYNLFDQSGKLIRAETISMRGKNENKLEKVNSLYLDALAERLVSIIEAVDH